VLHCSTVSSRSAGRCNMIKSYRNQIFVVGLSAIKRQRRGDGVSPVKLLHAGKSRHHRLETVRLCRDAGCVKRHVQHLRTSSLFLLSILRHATGLDGVSGRSSPTQSGLLLLKTITRPSSHRPNQWLFQRSFCTPHIGSINRLFVIFLDDISGRHTSLAFWSSHVFLTACSEPFHALGSCVCYRLPSFPCHPGYHQPS
jgi:hypothetical protein